ncbi:TPA: hypothetical protein N0F65_004620 [Lagenidium giganteum]|uniref:Elicitin n=1 Tax=Lagenidium giganteum TaxID=4803 RepID=A0AAV2Z7G4_9STRA|nr:TPA: hypothetical protein N0F65_004620 [Lagenidium giganteum]
MTRTVVLVQTIALLVLVAWTSTNADTTKSNSCTSQQLEVFKEAEPDVKRCQLATGLQFEMPPTTQLLPAQRLTLCKEKACKLMIGMVDDLEIPRCETVFGNQNMTLQTSLDKFTNSCDAPSPAPSRKFLLHIEKPSSDSGSGSGTSLPSRHNRSNRTATPDSASVSTRPSQHLMSGSLLMLSMAMAFAI